MRYRCSFKRNGMMVVDHAQPPYQIAVANRQGIGPMKSTAPSCLAPRLNSKARKHDGGGELRVSIQSRGSPSLYGQSRYRRSRRCQHDKRSPNGINNDRTWHEPERSRRTRKNRASCLPQVVKRRPLCSLGRVASLTSIRGRNIATGVPLNDQAKSPHFCRALRVPPWSWTAERATRTFYTSPVR